MEHVDTKKLQPRDLIESTTNLPRHQKYKLNSFPRIEENLTAHVNLLVAPNGQLQSPKKKVFLLVEILE